MIDPALAKCPWLASADICPYVFVRKDNRVAERGTLFDLDWFTHHPLYYKDPLLMSEVGFANQILSLEWKAFGASGMPMDRWVFFDCAVMPGFVAGFAHRTRSLSKKIKQVLEVDESLEWTPISLFIMIPAMAKDEWVAHNLCSVNSLVEREERFYGLGFLTKAFALWHANVNICCGVTQWGSPALKLHSHYGLFEVLTAYTPIHSYAATLTYRLKVDPMHWGRFLEPEKDKQRKKMFQEAGFVVEPKNEASLKSFQLKIEAEEGPFYLDSYELRHQELSDPIKVYQMK